MLKVKSTVRPKSLVIAAAVINAATELGLEQDMFITSGDDSKHMVGSKHYSGNALDIRTHHLSNMTKNILIKEIRRRLESDYTVIFEDMGKPNEHCHIQYNL
jgi:hypothetical protein